MCSSANVCRGSRGWFKREWTRVREGDKDQGIPLEVFRQEELCFRPVLVCVDVAEVPCQICSASNLFLRVLIPLGPYIPAVWISVDCCIILSFIIGCYILSRCSS